MDNLERTVGRSDITYVNLLAMIETLGYGISDKMYYMKEEGRGVHGMAMIDGMGKVVNMVDLYEDKKCISICVIRAGMQLRSDINKASIETEIPISEIGEPVVYSVDDSGVLFQTEQSVANSDYLYMCTQQSNNNLLVKGKQVLVQENMACSDNYFELN